MLYSSITLPLAMGLSAVSVAAQQLTKPALWGDLNFMGGVINGQLPTTGLAMSTWPVGQLARGCRETLVRDGKNPNNFRQYSLFMSDCAQEWHVCQENGASPSIESVFWAYARVPVRMRQWTNNIIHYKDGNDAYMLAYNVVVKGAAASTGTLIHEVMHSVDAGGGLYSMNRNSQEWRDAYDRDSAVPDNYARTNLAENLAQFPNLIIYDRFTNGRLGTHGDISRIGNQLQKVSDQGDWASPYGGRMYDLANSGATCTRRWNKDPSVRADNGGPVKRDGAIPEFITGPPEGFEFDPTDVTIEVVPIPQGRGMDQAPTNCTGFLS